MARGDRLSALDASFLDLERGPTHMHVASCLTFRGEPPAYDELVGAIEDRLHLVPRYRQRLAAVPLGQGRPVWVDDPHFNTRYHVRHAALPAPGSEAELQRLCGRVFSQRLDRAKPLWELRLVEGLEGERFALLSKTHHALVDGVAGVDITAVLLDTKPDPAPVAGPPQPWVPGPLPNAVELLADALLERATVPAEIARAALEAPRRVLGSARGSLAGLAALASAGLSPAPPSLLNAAIGPHRRFTWVHGDLSQVRAAKSRLGATVNDVVLTAVAGAVGRTLRRRGVPTDGLVLKAMVPVSVRADVERGALGNRVGAVYAPLPVGVADPLERLELIREAMASLKESGQVVGAQVIARLGNFAPPTIMAQAARLQARQRFFNLVVTNVPGPQRPLYLLGRELEHVYPLVPLAANQTVGMALMSYNGRLDFGLNADWDRVPDLDELAKDLRDTLGELVAFAGLPPAGELAGPRLRRAAAGAPA